MSSVGFIGWQLGVNSVYYPPNSSLRWNVSGSVYRAFLCELYTKQPCIFIFSWILITVVHWCLSLRAPLSSLMNCQCSSPRWLGWPKWKKLRDLCIERWQKRKGQYFPCITIKYLSFALFEEMKAFIRNALMTLFIMLIALSLWCVHCPSFHFWFSWNHCLNPSLKLFFTFFNS